MSGHSGHAVQTSLLMSGAGSPRGKQHLRELLEEYDAILSGRIASLKPLGDAETTLRENIEFENQAYKQKSEEAKTLERLAEGNRQNKAAMPNSYKLNSTFQEQGSDDDEDDDGRKARQEFFNAGQQVRRMFRAVRLYERKRKSDRLESLERRGASFSIQGSMGSYGNVADLLEKLDGGSDDESVFSGGGLGESRLGGGGTELGGGGPNVASGVFGGPMAFDQWTDEEVLEHLKGKIAQEKARNKDLRTKLRADLNGYIDAQGNLHSSPHTSSSSSSPTAGGGGGGYDGKQGSTSFGVAKATTPSGGGGARKRGGSPDSTKPKRPSLPPHVVINKSKATLLEMVELWCQWCHCHAVAEAQEAEKSRSLFRHTYGSSNGAAPSSVAVSIAMRDWGRRWTGISVNTHSDPSSMGGDGDERAWGAVSASRYICLNQIGVEQRKATALRAAIADCDLQLKLRHLETMLCVPDALVPKVVPPSLIHLAHAPQPTPRPGRGDDDIAKKKARRGNLTQTQQMKTRREEQRQSALKMSQQLSATVSDIIHCTNILTDIVYDEKVVAGLQKEVRQRTELLQHLIKWRHMADRARAANVDLK